MDSEDKTRTTLQGYVMALDWDEEDYPTVVSVMVEDGTEFEVQEGEVGDELLALEGAEVEVIGQLDRAEPEYPTILLESFKVLYDPFAEENDDEEDPSAGAEDPVDEDGLEGDDEFEPYEEEEEEDADGDPGDQSSGRGQRRRFG